MEVINAGRRGSTTADVLAHLNADAIAQHPDLVVLMIGTNDTLAGQFMLPHEVYEANLLEIVRRLRQSGSQTVLMTLLPCLPELLLTREDSDQYPDGPNAAIERANETVRRIGAAERCLLVDTFRLFLRAGNLGPDFDSLLMNEASRGMSDGVHPTPEGCRVIATAIWQCLTDASLKPRRIVCLGDSITAGAFITGEGTTTGQTYPAFLARLLNAA